MASQKASLESTKKFRFNSIWFVPLVSLLVAGWMFYADWSQQGVEITIVAEDAEGLEAGKTKVKARNVDLGTVTQIQLSENYEHALISVQMQKGTEKLLNDNTKFWVVKPRVGRDGVSGLGTLLSGAYIHMQPSQTGQRQKTFDLLDQPPLSTPNDKGIRLRLYSKNNAKMEVSTPIHFRGFEVGYIESVDFDMDREAITYRIFIKAPYDALVNDRVKFWITPGLSVEGSAKGLEVKMNSLETFVSGGISFGTVDANAIPKAVDDLTEFQLFATQKAAEEQRFDQHIGYIVLFNGSIDGLEPGAPVDINGMRVGTVVEVPFNKTSLASLEHDAIPRIPVLIHIEPQRFNNQFKDGQLTLDEWQTKLLKSFETGMRASIETSNLLTGAKQVSIIHGQDEQKFIAEYYEGYPIFPSTNGSFASLQTKLESIVDKVAGLPIDDTVGELNHTLRAAAQALESIHATSDKFDALITQGNTQALPSEFAETLNALQQVLNSYHGQGNIGQNLNQTLRILKQNLEDLQPLIQQLKQQPNALIMGKPVVIDQPPKAGVK